MFHILSFSAYSVIRFSAIAVYCFVLRCQCVKVLMFFSLLPSLPNYHLPLAVVGARWVLNNEVVFFEYRQVFAKACMGTWVNGYAMLMVHFIGFIVKAINKRLSSVVVEGKVATLGYYSFGNSGNSAAHRYKATYTGSGFG